MTHLHSGLVAWGSDQLQFALPALLEDWLLRDEGAAALHARDVKAGLLSSIAISRRDASSGCYFNRMIVVNRGQRRD